MNSKLRINLNAAAIAKTASLISNSVLLTTNVYLLGSGFSGYFRDRRQQNLSQNLLMTAELASSLASLTKIITETISKHHAGD